MKKYLKQIKALLKRVLIYDNVYYRSRFGYSEKFWNEFPFNLDVVNLGSNTGLFGFRYEGIPLKCANWALSPQSLNQDLAILKTYSSFIGPRGTIIVPLGPYSSCFKSYTDTELEKYYTILHPGVIENFSIEKQRKIYQLKDHPFVVAKKLMTKGVLRTLKQVVMRCKEPLEYASCPMSETQLDESAKSFIEGWKKQFRINDMDATLPSHIVDGRHQRVETLKEIKKFCEDRGFKMYIVLPPVTKALSNMFSPTFRENYIYSFLREAGIPDAMFLNYLDDSELQRNEYFYNSLFLNKTGGKVFTRRVLKDLGLAKQ